MVNQFNIHSIKLKSSEAIKRDEQRNFSEALKQYGACMLSLGQLLKEDNLAEELKSNAQTFKQVSQALKICKMCFERVSDIVDKEIPNSSSGGNTLTPNNSFGIGVTGNSNLSTSMINIPSSGFNSSSSSSLQQIPTSMNSSFHFSNRSSITSTTSNTPSDVNSLRSSMTFNTPPPISNNMPFSNGSTNPSAPSLPSTNLQPNISNNSSPTISPQLSNSPIIQSTLRQSTSSYGRDSLQSAIQPPLGTMSNRSSVQLSGPVIDTGKVEMTEENAISLLTLSNKYMISSLSSICELYIASIVNEELETPLKDCSIDLFTIFEISETYQALQLQKVVLYSFASHLKEIKKDPQWKTFPYKELVLLKNVKCLLQ
ncbi:predicted protein [Naegleria gruberi]|uniref:Predicted protein n=1 Tax=Naegleria gruberi TaxID=5762 RepID=D2W5G5_NAEGR|nr:uncharacterized protein NAEGRDRAFT_76657 [Naegleria gruberi]EFC35688.1 predicted protein [Naegleria gruberi]|eukprot:XP_002668432.1 predicted protein [Naegleria gruberi strain NEG-M]